MSFCHSHCINKNDELCDNFERANPTTTSRQGQSPNYLNPIQTGGGGGAFDATPT